MQKVIYQTVANRDNPDEVLESGPFLCVNEPWLGEGYYFWDEFIEYAKWWGKVHYRDNYMITRYMCIFDQDKFLDLLDPTYLALFDEYSCIVVKKFGDDGFTVPRVIEFIKETSKDKFLGVRAEARRSVNYTYNPSLDKTIPFVRESVAFLDLRPAVQICLFSKSALIKDSGTIVYPEEYSIIDSI